MISGVYWEKGDNLSNEDSLALEEVCTNYGECVLLVICDGVGSLNFGETASGYVVECMIHWFYDSGMWFKYAGRRKVKQSLRRAALDCHMKLKTEAGANNIKWASTCTLVCVWKRKYICMQIGDSSCYRIDRKKAFRVGKSERNSSGQLLACLGKGEFHAPQFVFGYLKKQDVILLATDGFLDSFEDKELAGIVIPEGEITRDRVEKRLKSIGEEAHRRGATDNRSAIFLMV